MQNITDRRKTLVQWIPAAIMGTVCLFVFIVLGHTPLMRALGMAVSISAMTLILQRFGVMLAVIGGFVLAFCPAVWSQTGGEETKLAVLMGIALLAALVIAGLLIWTNRLTAKAVSAGIIIFALLFWAVLDAPRSLRVTTLLSASLLYILIDVIMNSNPRPDAHHQPLPGAQHTLSLVLLLLIGVVNDPLFILLAPALLVGVYLSQLKLPVWYWGIILIAIIIGLRGMVIQYLATGWWLNSAITAEAAGIRVPYVIADGWRAASRWVYLINLVRNQFTDIGILLGVFGLARLARWYPALGITTLIAYSTYALFGLVYFGKDSMALLLPMMMIHVVWITYAVFAFGQWLQKSFVNYTKAGWLATAVFTIMPLALLGRIVGVL